MRHFAWWSQAVRRFTLRTAFMLFPEGLRGLLVFVLGQFGLWEVSASKRLVLVRCTADEPVI